MVLSATLRTVLSSTIAIRLVIRTPRMIQRRRYTLASVSASGATLELSACRETPGSSMVPSPRGPFIPGRPGSPPREGRQYGTGPYRKTFPGYPPPGRRGMLKASGDATTAPRGSRRIPMTAQPSDSGAAATKARTAEPLYGGSASRRVTVRDLAAAKARGEKWPMLTAYDALTAGIFDEAGIPVLLVGDSAGMVVYGHDTTIPVTVDDLIPLTAAVVRGTRRAMVVADLPFGSYQASAGEALATASRFLKEAGAHAVKLEGGRRVVPQAEELVAAGIPVMGHL